MKKYPFPVTSAIDVLKTVEELKRWGDHDLERLARRILSEVEDAKDSTMNDGDLEIGDVVRLSGHDNPRMTVTHVSLYGAVREYRVTWFDKDNHVMNCTFSRVALVRIKKVEQ